MASSWSTSCQGRRVYPVAQIGRHKKKLVFPGSPVSPRFPVLFFFARIMSNFVFFAYLLIFRSSIFVFFDSNVTSHF